MANTNSANSSESTAKMIPVLKKPKLKGKTFQCLTAIKSQIKNIFVMIPALKKTKMKGRMFQCLTVIHDRALSIKKAFVIDWKLASYYSYVKLRCSHQGKKLGAPLLTLSVFHSPSPPPTPVPTISGLPLNIFMPPLSILNELSLIVKCSSKICF